MKVLRIFSILAALCILTLASAERANAWCNPGILICGSVIDSNNAQGHTDVNRYNCTGTTNYNGKAHVYTIDHPGDSLWLRMPWTMETNDNGSTNKLHLFVLGSCNRNDCIAHADSVLNLDLPPGIYWIIVDGRNNITNQYELSVYCGDVPLSAELMSFTGMPTSSGIALEWMTASETNNDRFEIERRADSQEFYDLIAVVDGQGTTAEASSYHYLDNPAGSGMFHYKLWSVDLSGIRQVIGAVSVESLPDVGAEMVTDFQLTGNYPNPFNPSTSIRFDVAEAMELSLDIFDVQGRLLSNLVSGMTPAGSHEITFDAAGLSSGVYFARLASPARTEMMKMVLMK